MQLVEIVKGVKTFENNSAELPKDQEALTVAVHPYVFGIPGQKRYALPEGSGTVEGIESYITETGHPLIVFEEHFRMDFAARRIFELGKTQAYFVATRQDEPDPKSITWEEVIGFARRFGTPGLNFIGGFFWKDFEPRGRGCLGYTAHVFETSGFAVSLVPKAVISASRLQLWEAARGDTYLKPL